MVEYTCARCNYKTNNKRHYNDHLSRKIPCKKDKPHKLIKQNKYLKEQSWICDKCDKYFSTKSSLTRHIKTLHKNITNRAKNIIGNNNINGNNNNNNNNVNNNIEKQKIINNQIINIQSVINVHPYQYNDINDLSLFQQYLSLTCKSSPHSELLFNLNLDPQKPSYHNIRLGNINKNIMDVHNGEKWVKEMVKIAINNIIDSKTILIKMIFNKFRFFLNKRALYHIPKYYHYYGFGHCQQTYKNLMNYIKIFLYNNRFMENKNTKKIPDDKNDPVFWALSKKFEWFEIEKIISKMEKLEINFDKNSYEIKQQLLKIIDKRPKLYNCFKKFLKHINILIDDFQLDNDCN